MKHICLAIAALLITSIAPAQRSSSVQGQQSVRIVPRPDNDLSVRIWTGDRNYRVGDNIQINYRATRDAYVLIFTTNARGKTRQLLPNAYDDDNYVRGGETYSIPNRGYQLEVTPPTGRETLSIVAFRERNQALDYYSSRKSDPFPESDGARAAISRVIVKPDNDDRGRRYAEDSTTIQVSERYNNNRPDYPNHPDYPNYPDYDNHPGNSQGSGRLKIESDPSAAYVYIDGQYRGITPLDLKQVRRGSYDIIINRAGFQPVRRKVRIDNGEREKVKVDLKPIRYQ